MAEFLSIFHQGFHCLQAGYASYYSVILSAVRNGIQMGSCQDRRKGRVLSFQSGVDISGLVHSWFDPEFPEIIHKCFSSLYVFR